MTYPMMQHIPLKSAYLCQDCNSIGNCAEQCPACASAVLMNLSCVLDRDVATEETWVTRHGKYPAVVEIHALVA